MNRYEAMFVVKSDLSEEERKALFNQISETVTKNSGSVSEGSVWSEKRKLCFPIKKHDEGMYYLLNFNLKPSAITEIKTAYGLNENILRFMITRL